MKRAALLSVVLLAFMGCAASTEPESPDVDRTVAIQMRDNHFEPDEVEVRRGDTVTFRFVNRGSSRHDAFIGNADAQDEHERDARASVDDEHGGGHAAGVDDAVTLEPGGRDELTYTFAERGDVLIGCHEPGHYADGMKVTISVK